MSVGVWLSRYLLMFLNGGNWEADFFFFSLVVVPVEKFISPISWSRGVLERTSFLATSHIKFSESNPDLLLLEVT